MLKRITRAVVPALLKPTKWTDEIVLNTKGKLRSWIMDDLREFSGLSFLRSLNKVLPRLHTGLPQFHITNGNQTQAAMRCKSAYSNVSSENSQGFTLALRRPIVVDGHKNHPFLKRFVGLGLLVRTFMHKTYGYGPRKASGPRSITITPEQIKKPKIFPHIINRNLTKSSKPTAKPEILHVPLSLTKTFKTVENNITKRIRRAITLRLKGEKDTRSQLVEDGGTGYTYSSIQTYFDDKYKSKRVIDSVTKTAVPVIHRKMSENRPMPGPTREIPGNSKRHQKQNQPKVNPRKNVSENQVKDNSLRFSPRSVSLTPKRNQYREFKETTESNAKIKDFATKIFSDVHAAVMDDGAKSKNDSKGPFGWMSRLKPKAAEKPKSETEKHIRSTERNAALKREEIREMRRQLKSRENAQRIADSIRLRATQQRDMDKTETLQPQVYCRKQFAMKAEPVHPCKRMIAMDKRKDVKPLKEFRTLEEKPPAERNQGGKEGDIKGSISNILNYMTKPFKRS